MKHGDITPLDRLFFSRLKQKRNVNIIIADWGSNTGTGKSTLACTLARRWDSTFDLSHVFFDSREYMKFLADGGGSEGDVYVLDEAGAMFDRRRSMADRIVHYTQMLQIYRQLQRNTILTVPSVRVLDTRIVEYADAIVLVIKRGLARAHMVKNNPYQPEKTRTPKWFDVTWPPIENGWWREYEKLKRSNVQDLIQGFLGRGAKKPNGKKKPATTSKRRLVEAIQIQAILSGEKVSYAEIARRAGLSPGTTSTYLRASGLRGRHGYL